MISKNLTNEVQIILKPNIFSRQVFLAILPDNPMQRDELQLFTIVEKKLSATILDGKLELVSRTKKDVLIEEASFQQGLSASRENRVRLGRLLNIQYFIFVNSQIVNKVASVGIDLIEVETGRILLSRLYNWIIKNSDSLYANRILPNGIAIESWAGGLFAKEIFTPVVASGLWKASATGMVGPPVTYGIGIVLPVVNSIKFSLRVGKEDGGVTRTFAKSGSEIFICNYSPQLPLHIEGSVLFSLIKGYDFFGLDLGVGLGIDRIYIARYDDNYYIGDSEALGYSGIISIRPLLGISNTLTLSPSIDFYYAAPLSFDLAGENITVNGLNSIRFCIQLRWEI